MSRCSKKLLCEECYDREWLEKTNPALLKAIEAMTGRRMGCKK